MLRQPRRDGRQARNCNFGGRASHGAFKWTYEQESLGEHFAGLGGGVRRHDVSRDSSSGFASGVCALAGRRSGAESAGRPGRRVPSHGPEEGFRLLTNAHHQEESRRGSRLTLRIACELQVWRSVHWLGADDTELDSAILTWATTPIDHLWMRLQYTDAAGSSLLDVIADATSPFLAARQELTNMIVRPFADGPVSALPYHFVKQTGRVDEQCPHIDREPRCSDLVLV